MTAKRLIVRDGDYAWIDTTTGYVVEVEDAFDLINQLHEENEQLKEELNNCEKFRYMIFKRMDELRK